MQIRILETLGAGSLCSDSVVSQENRDGSCSVSLVKAESVGGSSGITSMMAEFVGTEALDGRSFVISPSTCSEHSPNSPLTACSLKSVCGSSMSSSRESVADRSFHFSSQNQTLGDHYWDPQSSDPSSDSSAIDSDPVKTLSLENWDRSSESSPSSSGLCPRFSPTEETPPSLALVPYGPCTAIQTESQRNPLSRLSLRGHEEDDFYSKHDERQRWWWQRPSFPWTEARENSFRTSSSLNYSRWGSPSREERTVIEPTGVGAGLANLGNTCFINAILQCFTHTVPLVQGLRSYNHEKPCYRHREGFCMLCALRDHIDVALNSSGLVVSPSNFFDNISHISSSFQKYYQEDAHEFLQCLLDRLESCCLDLRSKNDSLSSQDDNLVKQVFGGRLVSQLRCCNCGHSSNTYEPLVDLSLEIEDVDSLPHAIESFTKVEKLEDPEARLRCSNCNEEVAMEKQLLLDQAPLVASFHLKRFKIDGSFVKKIHDHVEFPLELDLQPYTIINHDNNVELKYQLYAVVKHSGIVPTSGHYISYVRSSPNMWHRLNDSKVHRVESEDVLFDEAYILFYARQDIPWFSRVMEVQTPCLDPHLSNLSPKSVLDNIDGASPSNLGLGNTDECMSNESKDAADRMSMQFSCETKNDSEGNESSLAAEASGSKQNLTALNESGAETLETLVIDASMRPRSSDCFEELSDENMCTVSPLGENICNQDADKARKSGSFPQTASSSESPEASYRIPSNHLKEEKRSGRKIPPNKPPMDPQRIEALRCIKRMQPGRGARFLAAVMGPNGGINKRKLRSSPCKKTSPHRKLKLGNLLRPVPVLR